MNSCITASIEWFSFEQGGRKVSPTGKTYSTVAKFGQDNSSCNEWSVIIKCLPDDKSLVNADKVEVDLLVPENAPLNLLSDNNSFQLCEGKRVVAECTIVR